MKNQKQIELDSLKWIVTKVNGKTASVALDYSGLKRTVDFIVKNNVPGIESVATQTLSMKELQDYSASLTEDDLILFGTDFQKKVWKALFALAHDGSEARILSYSEFATICGNRPGLRAVAHAVGLNPLAFIIPCHRVIPKQCIEDIEAAYESAIDTIFKGSDLYVFNAFDFGEYALGKQLKRELIALELCKK